MVKVKINGKPYEFPAADCFFKGIRIKDLKDLCDLPDGNVYLVREGHYHLIPNYHSVYFQSNDEIVVEGI